jgi:Galactose oxidase, central domain
MSRSGRVRRAWTLAVVTAALVVLVAPGTVALPRGFAAVSSAVATSYPTTGVSPPPTSYAAATFDATDEYVLMFGGNDVNGNAMATTWSFVHNNWTNLTGSIGPSPTARWASSMAYDAANGTVILFGGCLNPSCSALGDDTWSYAHDRWTNLSGALPVFPPPRGRAMMTYDASTGTVLLFGGIGVGGIYLNDLWGFKDGHWSPITTSVAPSIRGGSMMAYDPTANATILFGGNDGPYRFGDTWSLAHGNWTNITATVGIGPTARWVGEMTYDAADGYLLLVNGYNAGTYFGDEWTFVDGRWSALSVPNGPAASYGGVLVYDPADRYVLYFSGVGANGVYTSTLIYSDGTWTLLINPPGTDYALFFLTLLAILFLPVAVGLVLGTVLQRRRERRLGEGFVLPPSEPVQWIPSGPALARQRFLRLILAGGFSALLVILLVVPLLVAPGGLNFFFLLFELPLLLVLIWAVVFAQARREARAIAIVRSGVILRRRRSELRVPWSALQPGLMRPVRGMYAFQYVIPGRQAGVAGFTVTVDQAKAILRSPFAPPWVLTPFVAAALGLPVSPGWGSAAPPTGPPPSPPMFPPAPFPLPNSAPPLASSPAASPPTWSSPPPPPPPPPPTPQASVPAGPPPGTVPCPRCGQYNPVGRVAFCQSCGQRLH